MIPQVDPDKYPTTYAMIALWNHPNSPDAFRFAAWRLLLNQNAHGLQVLDDEDFANAGKKGT